MYIKQEWQEAIEQSKEPILEWIEAVLDHWTTKKRNLLRYRRRHKMLKGLLDIPDEERTVYPFLPILFDFLEDRYSFSFDDSTDPESELVDNPAFFEVVCIARELHSLTYKFVVDKEAPLKMMPSDSRRIKEKLEELLHRMAGNLSDEDFENEQDLLDSDLAYQTSEEEP